MKLIVEDDRELCKASVVESLESEKDDGKYHPLKIRGVFAKADYVNKNKRTYPFEMLKREFDRYIDEDVKTSRSFGEYEHPDNVRKSEAEAHENAAIFINSVELDEKNKQWIGEATVMAAAPQFGIPGTPKGSILAAHYYYSGNKNLCGFSTRGFGDLSEPDKNGVRKLIEFHLQTVDIVSNPSCAIYAEGILESKEFMIDTHGQIVECALSDYEKMINSSAHTYDLNKKREIYKAAWETLFSRI